MIKTWCIGIVNAAFLAAMENVLKLYRLPYDPDYPLYCFDERPCFLIGDTVKGFELKAEKVRKQHYEYEKFGCCTLFGAIEPLTGKRIGKVYDKRRKIEYADFMKLIADKNPDAKKIRIIQDNLNTHNVSSFYENFDAETASKLADRFEFHYTPKCGSWLNTIEIEFSAVARCCLNKRIPTKQEVEKQVLAFFKEREKNEIKIDWQFNIIDARKKMKRLYVDVNPANENV